MNTKYPHTLSITVSPKKGLEIPTTWAVCPTYGYPSLKGFNGAALNWQGLPKDGKQPEIYCYLLRSDIANIEAQGNRADHAGYNTGYEYINGIRTEQPDNPGTFAFRGRDLGEMRVAYSGTSEIDLGWPNIKIRGFEEPSSLERAFIREQITSKLTGFIRVNSAALKNTAKQALIEHVEQLIAETVDCIQARKTEAFATIAKL